MTSEGVVGPTAMEASASHLINNALLHIDRRLIQQRLHGHVLLFARPAVYWASCLMLKDRLEMCLSTTSARSWNRVKCTTPTGRLRGDGLQMQREDVQRGRGLLIAIDSDEDS